MNAIKYIKQKYMENIVYKTLYTFTYLYVFHRGYVMQVATYAKLILKVQNANTYIPPMHVSQLLTVFTACLLHFKCFSIFYSSK